MPEEIELADGTKRIVPTDEEYKNLKAGHDANKEKRPIIEKFNKLKEDIGLKDDENISDKIKEMQEAANPNWQAARDKMKRMQQALKEKDVEMDDNGNIVENKQGLSQDEINKLIDEKASQIVEQKLSSTEKVKLLSDYPEDKRDDLEKATDKLMALGGTFKENLDIAAAKLSFNNQPQNQTHNVLNNISGDVPPYNPDNKKDYSNTEQGHAAANTMGLRFAQKKPENK